MPGNSVACDAARHGLKIVNKTQVNPLIIVASTSNLYSELSHECLQLRAKSIQLLRRLRAFNRVAGDPINGHRYLMHATINFLGHGRLFFCRAGYLCIH